MGQFSANPDAFSRGAQRRIYARLRAQIEDGTLAAGTRLMSTRAIAAELGVSRTTVTAAYEQLAAEGFVLTSVGKAATVASIISTQSGQKATFRPTGMRPSTKRIARFPHGTTRWCMCMASCA